MNALRYLFALVTIFTLSMFNLAYGQTSVVIKKELTRKDNAGDALHRTANDFSTEVGKKLKEGLTLKVKDVSIDLVCRDGNITITYIAILIPCRADDADWYFDHRGAMSFGKGDKSVFDDANNRMMGQVAEALPKFQETYPGKGRVRVTTNYAMANNCSQGAGALHEAFFIVKKQ